MTRLFSASGFFALGMLLRPTQAPSQARRVLDSARVMDMRADSLIKRADYTSLLAARIPAALSVRLYERLNDESALTTAHLRLARLYDDMGWAGSALNEFRAASGAARLSHESTSEFAALEGMAGAFRKIGDADSALAVYQRTTRLAESTNDSTALLRSVFGIASVYNALDRADSADGYFRRSLDVARRRGDRRMETSILFILATVEGEHGRPATADSLLRSVGALADSSDDPEYAAGLMEAIGGIHRANGRLDSASAYYDRAIKHIVANAPRVHDWQVYASALVAKGTMYWQAGMAELGRSYIERALPLARSASNRADEAHLLTLIGETYQASGTREKKGPFFHTAIAYYDSAAAVLASLDERAGSDANRLAREEAHTDLFEYWAAAWLALEDSIGHRRATRGALGVTERAKAQALLELMRSPTLSSASRKAKASAHLGTGVVAIADSVLAPLAASHTAALSYFVTRGALVVWLLRTTGDLQMRVVPVSADSIASLVTTLRRRLGADDARLAMVRGVSDDQDPLRGVDPVDVTGESLDDVLTALQRVLLPDDLASLLPIRGEIVVVPDGVTCLVPFATLPLPGRGTRLGEQLALRYAPSFGVLSQVRGRTPGSPRVLVVGNPSMPEVTTPAGATSRLRPLPGAEAEARSVAAMYDAQPLSGPDATETAVWNLLPSAAIVHLATHGLAYGSEERVRDSYVALASDELNDGLLTVGEILDRPNLSLRAEIIVLSACQTGLGDVTRAEGTVGLQRALLARGARSVMVSLWSVDDRATAALMKGFYQHWRAGATKAEALRLAQADVRAMKGFEHPRFWAAFQLVGAP